MSTLSHKFQFLYCIEFKKKVTSNTHIIGKVYKENKNVIGYWEGLARCKKIIKWCKGVGEGLEIKEE